MDKETFDHLMSLAYEELTRLARTVRRGEANATLSTGSLVHEAYLRLIQAEDLDVESQVHLKHLLAQVMRRILVDAARQRATRRKGGDLHRVTLDRDLVASGIHLDETLAFDEALKALERDHPRWARTVEMRFFGGYTIPETAHLLGVGERTVSREWTQAKGWLNAWQRKHS
ncbi:MAG: ECF-type sigma factor [Bacteroidota bacterium]